MQNVLKHQFYSGLENLTIDYINRGALGYAQYALEYPLKDKIICVDYARRKVKFKDKNNNVITDPEMSQLGTQFFQSIKDKNTKLINEQGMKLKEKRIPTKTYDCLRFFSGGSSPSPWSLPSPPPSSDAEASPPLSAALEH